VAADRDPHPADHPGPFVVVADLGRPTLDDDQRHHLVRVLRRRPGDPLTVGDGAGRWCTAVQGAEGDLEVTGDVISTPRARPELTIAFALVKGDKPELVVQKLTELGIDRIIPFRADRSVVRWDDDKAARVVARLRAVAASATMQCHRPHLPEVADVTDLAGLLGPDGPGGGVALADREGSAPSLERPAIAVGPEGGWSEAEAASPGPRVALGAHVLRAETAAVTAGALLAALRGGVVTAGGR